MKRLPALLAVFSLLTSTIKKSDFNLAGPAMLRKALGDDVAITINIEAGAKES